MADTSPCPTTAACVNSYKSFYCLDNAIFRPATGNDLPLVADPQSAANGGGHDTATVALAVTLAVVLAAVLIATVIYGIRYFFKGQPTYNDLGNGSTYSGGTESSVGYGTVNSKLRPMPDDYNLSVNSLS